ncbi:hypothetical protein NUW54_g5708 [Trametes sanguinea]|uniref:Uncharacterized protein n=1 Tax=Trametes sanguinea TaxID=158606 RepID=A0ACC1PXC1_9APHY|nr:hypothetical protein NUW54_g5708 [Trametes sanguinea]
MRHKSEAFESFKAFEAWLLRRHGARIQFLNVDRGGEYLSEDFKSYLEENGVEYKLSVHDTSEEAGVSERLNRTLMEKVRAMLITSGMPRYLWGEAVMHATWLKNRTSTKALGGRTPYEAVTGSPAGHARGTRMGLQGVGSRYERREARGACKMRPLDASDDPAELEGVEETAEAVAKSPNKLTESRPLLEDIVDAARLGEC